MELVVAGSNDSIMMVEGGALEVSEEDVVEALTVAQGGIRELIGYQEELLKRRRPRREDGVGEGRRHRGPRRSRASRSPT